MERVTFFFIVVFVFGFGFGVSFGIVCNVVFFGLAMLLGFGLLALVGFDVAFFEVTLEGVAEGVIEGRVVFCGPLPFLPSMTS